MTFKLPSLKRTLGGLALSSVGNMGDIIIITSVAAWLASSAAQIIGIATNKNYTHEQKKFMITQETADALTNIGLYFGITKSFKWISSKMVSTGKLAPKSILKFMEDKNVLGARGRFGFDLTKVPGFNNIKGEYSAFKDFADATAAITGGIISSNILTPIIRNEVASYRQNKYKQNLAQVSNIPAPNKPQTEVQTPHISTQRHTFADFSRSAMRV